VSLTTPLHTGKHQLNVFLLHTIWKQGMNREGKGEKIRGSKDKTCNLKSGSIPGKVSEVFSVSHP